jgi:hypothetical protein
MRLDPLNGFRKKSVAIRTESLIFGTRYRTRVLERRSLPMRKLFSLIGILALFVGFILPHGSSLGAGKAAERTEKPVFIDLDGDGFDDNATPEEQNSTIDKPKSEAAGSVTDTTTANTGFFDFGSTMKPKGQLFLNNSSAFASAKQHISCGLLSRGGFGSSSDFGGDSGTGVVIGGCCVGGVCH